MLFIDFAQCIYIFDYSHCISFNLKFRCHDSKSAFAQYGIFSIRFTIQFFHSIGTSGWLSFIRSINTAMQQPAKQFVYLTIHIFIILRASISFAISVFLTHFSFSSRLSFGTMSCLHVQPLHLGLVFAAFLSHTLFLGGTCPLRHAHYILHLAHLNQASILSNLGSTTCYFSSSQHYTQPTLAHQCTTSVTAVSVIALSQYLSSLIHHAVDFH